MPAFLSGSARRPPGGLGGWRGFAHRHQAQPQSRAAFAGERDRPVDLLSLLKGRTIKSAPAAITVAR